MNIVVANAAAARASSPASNTHAACAPGYLEQPSAPPSRAASPSAIGPSTDDDGYVGGELTAVPRRLQRPPNVRMGSTFSAIRRPLTGTSTEQVAACSEQLSRAVADARSSGLGNLWRRKSALGRLRHQAERLAGPKCSGYNREQTQAIVARLQRPETEATRARPRFQPVLANTPATLAQPSVEPLYAFSDALMRQTATLLDVLFDGATDDVTVTLLRRSIYALEATDAALESYDEYPLTPGHNAIHRYQRDLLEHRERARHRIAKLADKEDLPRSR